MGLITALGRIFKLRGKYGLEDGAYYGPRPNFQAPGEVWFRGGSLLRALGRIFKLRGKYGLEEGAYCGPSAEFPPELRGKYGLEERAYYGPLAQFSSSGGSMVERTGLITGPRPNFQAPGEVWFRGGSLLRALGRIFKLRWKYGLEEGAYYGPSAEFSSSGGSMVERTGLITGPRPTFQAPGEVWSRGRGLLRALGRIFKLRGKYGQEQGPYYGPSTDFSSSEG